MIRPSVYLYSTLSQLGGSTEPEFRILSSSVAIANASDFGSGTVYYVVRLQVLILDMLGEA